ncbi:MAG: DNA-directed RNA polymerase subunit alpha [Patescibacteria group bacterium]|nr:DNA-directed RNA polymerase subunit alpha [Patescibacteria group bacterium]
MEFTYLSESVSIKKISETVTDGVFEIEGLYNGYGLTLGNALRRALFSSLPGAAITQVKIKGVDHEFSTIPGVIEDVVEICLNFKKVRFRLFTDEPQTLMLKVKGEKDVLAGDIETNSQVEIITPDIHIASLSSKSSDFEVEIRVERGLGYVPVEARKFEKLPIGTISLDSLFSPVIKVNFTVENMRVGDRTDYNRLKMEVRTDGSITPSSAMHKASNILKDHFDKLSKLEVMEINKEPEKETKIKKAAKKKSK